MKPSKSPTSSAVLIFIAALLGTSLWGVSGAYADEPKAAMKPAKSTASASVSSPFAGLSDSNSNEPTYIKADTLTLRQKERTFVYAGNVVVTQGDMTITSDTLEGSYDEKNVIQKIVAYPNVTINKAPDMKGRSNRAVYEAASETVTLTEAPELEQGESVLTADLIRIHIRENRSSAEGQVRMKMVKRD